MGIMSREIADGQLLKNKIKTDGRRCNDELFRKYEDSHPEG